MNRVAARRINKPANASIKSRIGNPAGGAAGSRLGRKGKTLSSAPGKIVASRLGLPVKTRVGKGRISDAREKIILNRVSKGRIGTGRLGNRLGANRLGGSGAVVDARSKIEATRMKKKVLTTDASKLKSLKITANLRGMGPANLSSRPLVGVESRLRQARQPASEGIFANSPPEQMSPYGSAIGRGSRSLRVSVPVDDHLDSNFLTRTIRNYQAGGSSSTRVADRGWSGSLQSSSSAFGGRGGYERDEDMEMDDDPPPRMRISNNLQSRLDSHSQDDSQRYKLIVSNLQPTVTTEDIIELFGDIGTPISAKMTSPGHAEVIYSKKGDCLKAVDAYHNRLLDGSPMRVVMESNSTTLKSAAGSTMKLPKASSSIKIQPDISAIHKVLFNPSSGNSTRGLFKGGQ